MSTRNHENQGGVLHARCGRRRGHSVTEKVVCGLSLEDTGGGDSGPEAEGSEHTSDGWEGKSVSPTWEPGNVDITQMPLEVRQRSV